MGNIRFRAGLQRAQYTSIPSAFYNLFEDAQYKMNHYFQLSTNWADAVTTDFNSASYSLELIKTVNSYPQIQNNMSRYE